jgi:hypothetical protein
MTFSLFPISGRINVGWFRCSAGGPYGAFCAGPQTDRDARRKQFVRSGRGFPSPIRGPGLSSEGPQRA